MNFVAGEAELKCAMCATGHCLHSVQEGNEEACRNRPAETMFSGTLLCLPCTSGRISIEEQLAFWERQNAASRNESATESSDESVPIGPDDIRFVFRGGAVEPSFESIGPSGAEHDAVLEPGGRKDDAGHDDGEGGKRESTTRN